MTRAELFMRMKQTGWETITADFAGHGGEGGIYEVSAQGVSVENDETFDPDREAEMFAFFELLLANRYGVWADTLVVRGTITADARTDTVTLTCREEIISA